MIVNSPGCSRGSPDMRRGGDFLLACMRARGDPDRTIADPAPQRGKLRRIGGKRGRRRL